MLRIVCLRAPLNAAGIIKDADAIARADTQA
jgi:hypothetical protein